MAVELAFGDTLITFDPTSSLVLGALRLAGIDPLDLFRGNKMRDLRRAHPFFDDSAAKALEANPISWRSPGEEGVAGGGMTYRLSHVRDRGKNQKGSVFKLEMVGDDWKGYEIEFYFDKDLKAYVKNSNGEFVKADDETSALLLATGNESGLGGDSVARTFGRGYEGSGKGGFSHPSGTARDQMFIDRGNRPLDDEWRARFNHAKENGVEFKDYTGQIPDWAYNDPANWEYDPTYGWRFNPNRTVGAGIAGGGRATGWDGWHFNPETEQYEYDPTRTGTESPPGSFLRQRGMANEWLKRYGPEGKRINYDPKIPGLVWDPETGYLFPDYEWWAKYGLQAPRYTDWLYNPETKKWEYKPGHTQGGVDCTRTPWHPSCQSRGKTSDPQDPNVRTIQRDPRYPAPQQEYIRHGQDAQGNYVDTRTPDLKWEYIDEHGRVRHKEYTTRWRQRPDGSWYVPHVKYTPPKRPDYDWRVDFCNNPANRNSATCIRFLGPVETTPGTGTDGGGGGGGGGNGTDGGGGGGGGTTPTDCGPPPGDIIAPGGNLHGYDPDWCKKGPPRKLNVGDRIETDPAPEDPDETDEDDPTEDETTPKPPIPSGSTESFNQSRAQAEHIFQPIPSYSQIDVRNPIPVQPQAGQNPAQIQQQQQQNPTQGSFLSQPFAFEQPGMLPNPNQNTDRPSALSWLRGLL